MAERDVAKTCPTNAMEELKELQTSEEHGGFVLTQAVASLILLKDAISG